MKRYLRIELLLLAAQVVAIGELSIVSRVWEVQVDRALGDPNKLPALAHLFFTHHTLIFAVPAILLLLLYGFCFHRFDRLIAGRRFVIVSLSLLILLTCATTFARQLAEQSFQWQSMKRDWKWGTKVPAGS